MCGIFAWAGKNPKTFNRPKYDILGMYNTERGKDSCGVSFDGDIFHGLATEKIYADFSMNNDIKPVIIPSVIGHTRAASFGNVVNQDNAHPFGFGTIKDKNIFEFIGCHNGTLYNKEYLAELYNLETVVSEEFRDANNLLVTNTRKKIDSEILLEIIYKTKSFKVLSKYNGAAALVFTNLNEPNVIYVWKGASKFYSYASNAVQEERPLFYYKESKNSLYISSLEKSLCMIGGKVDTNVFSFEENTIYKITNGDIDNAILTPVSRVNATQKEVTTYTAPVSNMHSRHGYLNDFYDIDDESPIDHYNENRKHGKQLAIAYRKAEIASKRDKIIEKEVIKNLPNIYNEKLPRLQNEYGNRVYYNKLRYWRTGHLITGVYTWVPNFGYYALDEFSIENSEKMLLNLVGLPFINGEFIKDTTGLDLTLPEIQKYIPFKEDKRDKVLNTMFYFIQGVKLIERLDYRVTFNKYHESHIKKGIHIDYYTLSQMSAAGVIDMNLTNKIATHQGIIKGGLLLQEDTSCVLGSEKVYKIKGGNLIGEVKNDAMDRVLFGDDEYKKLKTKEDLMNLKPLISAEEELDQLIENTDNDAILNQLIDEALTEVSCDVAQLIVDIKAYNMSSSKMLSKIKTLEILQDYIETINE